MRGEPMEVNAGQVTMDPPFADRNREMADVDRVLSLCEVQSTRSGSALPLGAHVRGAGVNFALFSRHATGVRLDLFERPDDEMPVRSIILNPTRNRTGDIWHVWLEGIRPGQPYGFHVAGPFAPADGHRFNTDKLLIDPYATAIAMPEHCNYTALLGYDPESPLKDLSLSSADDAASAPKGIITDAHFNWQGDQPLCHSWATTVIYELHVRGFTIHPNAGISAPGTYRGLTEKIPYLKDLGITAVELMPVQEFGDGPLSRHLRAPGHLSNYWGYDPIGFFAPKASYASVRRHGAQVLEFKEMVRAFHAEDLEIILDIVFNHTAEGNELGPTLSFRGIDNSIYYWLEENKRFYRDFTGTGQTINATHPVVRDMILDALRYWVMEMHVDGFRFDLASVLGRDREGHVLADAPLLERIAEDPILRDTKLIAEAWDAAGAYQLGIFADRRWAEWNGRYRDDVRRYWRGDASMVPKLASRLCGSTDLFGRSGKGPECSINFITCHDGFTMNDLVSYSQKHNDANGEGNRDGPEENYSCNYGIEGDSDLPDVERTRLQQLRNFFLTLAVSRGVPMILGGDEFRRTQKGNNNPFCQDNDVSWIDWARLQRYRDLHRFVRGMLQLRHAYPVLSRVAFYTDKDVAWFDPAGTRPDWNDPSQKSLGWLIGGKTDGSLFLMFNAEAHPVTFTLPPLLLAEGWYVAADTAKGSQVTMMPGTAVATQQYVMEARSSAILIAH